MVLQLTKSISTNGASTYQVNIDQRCFNCAANSQLQWFAVTDRDVDLWIKLHDGVRQQRRSNEGHSTDRYHSTHWRQRQTCKWIWIHNLQQENKTNYQRLTTWRLDFISQLLWSLLIPVIWLCHHLLHGVVSVHLWMLLVDTRRLCGSWSVTGHNHRKVIGQDIICADLHKIGPGLSGNGWAETMCDEGDWNLVVR